MDNTQPASSDQQLAPQHQALNKFNQAQNELQTLDQYSNLMHYTLDLNDDVVEEVSAPIMGEN